MAIIMGKGCIEAICGLMGWKGHCLVVDAGICRERDMGHKLQIAKGRGGGTNLRRHGRGRLGALPERPGSETLN